MARIATILILALSAILAFPTGVYSGQESAFPQPEEPTGPELGPTQITLSTEEQELVELAVGRFDAQGLALPEINYVFHDDLHPCGGHKGMYHKSTRTLEMCSMDLNTVLHELAHAWANENLTDADRAHFVSSRDLDSWNDHGDAWERRGTEHIAETIAWALAEDPHHVKWVETHPDGSTHTSYRILTIDVDVDSLLANFKEITGLDPIFREASEWAVDGGPAPLSSPEIRRPSN